VSLFGDGSPIVDDQPSHGKTGGDSGSTGWGGDGLRAGPANIACEGVLTGVRKGPISAAPVAAGRSAGGLLIEIVELWEGMRGRRRGSPDGRAFCERLEALVKGPA
jgi:hypothetical protein